MRIAVAAMIGGCLALANNALADDLGAYERKAMRGDYQAQRNLAYCYHTAKCDGFIAPDEINSCAWRYIIIAAGHRYTDNSDIGNFNFYCRKSVTAEQKAVARSKAENLFWQIYKRPFMPALD